MLAKGRVILDHKHSGETVSEALEANVGRAYGVSTKKCTSANSTMINELKSRKRKRSEIYVQQQRRKKMM